jgi:hypothetical protein
MLIERSVSMKDKEKLVLGILPVKRSFLSLDVAAEEKEKLYKTIAGIKGNAVKLVDIDDVCERGVLFKPEDVDFVFIPLVTGKFLSSTIAKHLSPDIL